MACLPPLARSHVRNYRDATVIIIVPSDYFRRGSTLGESNHLPRRIYGGRIYGQKVSCSGIGA